MNTKNTSKQDSTLFVRANAAWDRGDLRRAFQLFLRGAESGDSSCQLDLGYFFDYGLHVKKDKSMARRWYHQAYRQGDSCAANNIATIHRDWGEAGRMIWWYRRAVAMGDHDAFLDLGKYYEKGIGLAKNPEKAKQCYRRILDSEYVMEFSKEEANRRLARLQKHERHAA